MDKKAWREKITALQKDLTKSEWTQLSKLIHNKVIDYRSWQEATCIAIYYSVRKEVDTLSLIKQGLSAGKNIYLPKCYPEKHQLIFYKVDSLEGLETGHYGIAEPIPEKCTPLTINQLDLIFVPGLAFDQRGYRIGYGGGYYDRFLENIPARIEKVSLAFSFQVVQNLPEQEFDIPIDTLITNEELMLIRNKLSNREEK